jgi:hypothetical protein
VSDLGFTVWPPASVPVLAFHVMPPAVAPLYSAVIVCGLPTALRAEVVHVVWLDEFKARLAHPEIAVPSLLNVTVPFAPGLPADAVTVAVKVTLVPYVLGFRLLTTEVVVGRVFAAIMTASVGLAVPSLEVATLNVLAA